MENERKKKRPKKAELAPKRRSAPDVVYTQPEPLDRKKLFIRLATVAAVVLALFLGFSIFFRVDTIVVSGAQKYNPWTILEASGIEEGEGLLTFGKAKACAKITEALPYVKTVRIGIKLPGTVKIYIEEVAVVYAAQDEGGGWWLITSDGRIVEKTNADKAKEHTLLRGFRLTQPEVGKQAHVAEQNPDATNASGEEIIVTVTNKERLDTALEITTWLERNEILGGVSVLDVTDMGDIELWYGQRYQVLLGGPSDLDRKVTMMEQIICGENPPDTGILDLTFKDKKGEVIYRPFE